MTAPTPSVAVALAQWRSNLIDLSRRNPLLHLRPTKSSYLVISHPGAQTLYERLQAGKSWSFWMPPVDEDDDSDRPAAPVDLERLQPRGHELVCADLGRRQLLRVLTNLYRRALTDYQERGLQILHLACGVLEWRDADDREPFRSPLLLVPVELTRKSLHEPFVLTPTEDEPLLNPALQTRLLQDFDFRLPMPPQDEEEKTLSAYLAEVQAAVAGLPGWRVETTALLTLFSFFKGVMYRDLLDNAGRVAAHPVIRALAGEAVEAALSTEIITDEEDLDTLQPPDRTFHILDADGSQRLCLEAAARGQSFVLQGPPGTGKSQTIANLIAACLANQKTILFVSEKMAALEVVYKRLRQLGLGDYCLELHSHKANKRAVVAELRRCLEEKRPPQTGPAAEDGEKLWQRREQLNRYVEALHRPREPLQQSAWWALGELARCHALPAVPLRLAEGTDMTPTWLEESRQALQRAGQLWRVQDEANFPWRGFKIERFNLQLRDEVIGLIEKVRGRLERLSTVAREYADKIDADGPIPWLLRVGDLLEASPRPPLRWLTAPDLQQLAAELDRCAEQYRQRGQTRAPLTDRYGPSIWQLPEGTADQAAAVWRQASPLLPQGDEKGAGFLRLQQQLRGWAADTQRRIPGWLSEARTLEKWLGLTLPQGATAGRHAEKLDPCVADLRRLLRLANLCQTDTPPEKSWVADAAALEQARTLIGKTRPPLTAYRQGKADLLQRYTEALFELDLERLAEAFQGRYASWRRFFSAQYRRDRRAIGRRSLDRTMPASVAEDVVAARDVLRTRRQLEAEQTQRLPVLGRYEKNLDTDLDAAERATRVAGEAGELSRQLECDTVPDKLADVLSARTPPSDKNRAAAKRLHDSLGAWLHGTQELQAVLPLDLFPGIGQPLEEAALSALHQYARELQTSLNHFAALVDPVLGRAVTPPADTATLLADLREAEQQRTWEAAQETEAARWAERFGPGFQGVATDWNALRAALTWTQRLRALFADHGSEALPDKVIRIATGAVPAPSSRELRSAQEQFEHALHSLEHRFEPPAPLCDGKRLGELSAQAQKEYLQTLRDRVGELADWCDWRHLGERFAHLGLTAFWEALQKEQVPAAQLADVFLKATLGEWVESVFREDAALGPFRRAEHERAISEFRELDRGLIRQTAQRVAQRVEDRRPQAADARPGSEIALLLREAHKKTRHLPIRRLFEEMPELLLQLKPCLLMSPLSVSQFLPAEKMLFDIVVFDEASQICPEDAVGAIYRGRQAIVVGDDKQLPPTSFFQQNALDDDEDEQGPAAFESILDACLGAGLRPYLLRWHYRSRHEALIAYANQHFYDNRLVTFPAARARHPGVGVHFHHVPDGVYDRGGRRDNLREAEVVADLVLEHVRTHGDRKTLGVIAFSQAQMTAIADEIDRRLHELPELEALFTQDRLEGFFVKNLETVQGDERDVILLSVGYGPDARGQLSMHFGPLNREGGQRRLNVAVTRAREKLVVVSSLRAADLDLGASKAAGVVYLHGYLDYAERGAAALAAPPQAQAEGLSPLERDVLAEVRRLGYDVEPQVGCSGYRIDLGVVAPDAPGRFLLGIECDGATYHAATTARDRDRLRHEVLEQLGWRLHRIWAPAWLMQREEEVERLRQALTEARQGLLPETESPPPACDKEFTTKTQRTQRKHKEEARKSPGTQPEMLP